MSWGPDHKMEGCSYVKGLERKTQAGPDSEWLRLISRCYLGTEDMKDRMNKIAERIAGLEELERLTRVEVEIRGRGKVRE